MVEQWSQVYYTHRDKDGTRKVGIISLGTRMVNLG